MYKKIQKKNSPVLATIYCFLLIYSSKEVWPVKLNGLTMKKVISLSQVYNNIFWQNMQ